VSGDTLYASPAFRYTPERWTENALCKAEDTAIITTRCTGTRNEETGEIEPPEPAEGVDTSYHARYTTKHGVTTQSLTFDRIEIMPTMRLFISHRGELRFTNAAKDICARCAVQAECLDYALRLGSHLVGVFGGTSERERREIHNQTAAARAAAA
jgi:hypothetical protein